MQWNNLCGMKESRIFIMERVSVSNLFFNFAIRSASLVSSVLLIIAVSSKLSLHDQGVYYLLQSFVALTFFFDLGIGFVLANMAGIANAKLPTERAKSSISVVAVARFGIKWCLLAGSLFTIIVGLAGIRPVMNLPTADWLSLVMWGLLVLGTGCNLGLGALLSLFEGLGFVRQAAIVRFAQAFANGASFLAIVNFNHNPFSIGLSTAISVIVAGLLFVRRFGREIRHFVRSPPGHALVWTKDVLPFQWRVGISWLTGYFMFQAPTFAIATFGSIYQAGRFGLSMQIVLAILSVAQVYLTFCVARWAAKASDEASGGIFRDYLISVAVTTAIVFAGGVVLLMGIHFLAPPWLASRVLPEIGLVQLILGTCGFQAFMCGNFYFRAQLRESLWPVSVMGAAVIIIGGITYRSNIEAMVATSLYMCIGMLVGVLSMAVVWFSDLSTRAGLTKHA
jgi:hypothetical protein